jgi:hypothetical protein
MAQRRKDQRAKLARRANGGERRSEMDLLDGDGDGQTSFGEARVGLSLLDENGDGKISWGEYMNALKNGKLTSDDNAHGMYCSRLAKVKEIVIYMVSGLQVKVY